jgi:tetratricopeptide (TPR) repeat protein
LGKAVLPLNLNLVYPRWTIDAHAIRAFLPLVLLGAGLALCWRFRRSWGRHALFGLGCFGITLFPGLGFFDAKFLTTWQVSDHLQYLPLLAAMALAAAALGWLTTPRLHTLASAALLLSVCALGFQRARVFASEESLMRDTLARNPAAASAHNDLGVILANRKDLSGALTQFTAAAQANPKDAAVQSNLGQMLGMLGNLREAETHLRAALALKPSDADAHARLAKVLSAQSRDREARLHLRLALRLREAVDTRLQLAGLLYKAGDIRAAVGQFRQLLRTQPGHAEALNNLAWLLATCADEQVRGGAEAVQCAEHACRLTGFKQSVFLSTLAAAYADAGRFPEAIATAETALRQQTAAGETRLAAINQQLLTRYYRAGKPYRERPVLAEAGQASL